MWPPADIESGGANNDIELVLLAVCSSDTLGSDFVDVRRHHRDIVLAQRLEIPVAWCWSTASHGEVFRDDQVGNLGMANEFGSHILLRELQTLVSRCGTYVWRRWGPTYLSGFLLLPGSVQYKAKAAVELRLDLFPVGEILLRVVSKNFPLCLIVLIPKCQANQLAPRTVAGGYYAYTRSWCHPCQQTADRNQQSPRMHSG